MPKLVVRFSQCHLHGLHLIKDNKHGLPRHTHKKWNLFWLTVFSFACVGFLVESVLLISEYLEKRTVTDINIEDISQDLQFPAVTICPINPFKISEIDNAVEINNAQAAYHYIAQTIGVEMSKRRSKRETTVEEEHCAGYDEIYNGMCVKSVSSDTYTNVKSKSDLCGVNDAIGYVHPKSRDENDYLFRKYVDPTGTPLSFSDYVYGLQIDESSATSYSHILFDGTSEPAQYVHTWADGEPSGKCGGGTFSSFKAILSTDNTWVDGDETCFTTLLLCYKPIPETSAPTCIFETVPNATASTDVFNGYQFLPGEIIMYTPDDGFSISCPDTIHCLSTGEWSAPVPYTTPLDPNVHNLPCPLPLFFKLEDLSASKHAEFSSAASRYGYNISATEGPLLAQAKHATAAHSLEINDTTREFIAHSMEEVLPVTQFNAQPIDKNEFTETPHAMFGKCFTFNRNGTAKSTKTGSSHGLKLNAASITNELLFTTDLAGGAVQVHGSNEVPFPEVFGQLLSTGADYLMVFSKTTRNRIHDCSSGVYGNDSVYEGHAYSHETCVRGCLQSVVADQIGCFDPTTIKPRNDDRPYCNATNEDLAGAVTFANKKCTCLSACSETIYSTTVSQANWPVGVDRQGRMCKDVQAEYCDVKRSFLSITINYNTAIHEIELQHLLMDLQTLLFKLSDSITMWISFSAGTIVEIYVMLRNNLCTNNHSRRFSKASVSSR